MAVPPVLSDLVSAPNAPQRSGRGREDRHLNFYELPDNLTHGDYNGDGTVSDDGEFKIALLEMAVNGSWGLYPHLEAFGDGTGSLRRAIDARLLDPIACGPVERAEEFAWKLLDRASSTSLIGR